MKIDFYRGIERSEKGGLCKPSNYLYKSRGGLHKPLFDWNRLKIRKKKLSPGTKNYEGS